MEDSRKEKREKAFFSLHSFETVKRQREDYFVSLRKKNRSNRFKANRQIKGKSMIDLKDVRQAGL